MRIGNSSYRALKFLLIFIFFVNIVFVVEGQELKNKITILAEDNFLPFSDENGNGLSNEIVINAFKVVGIDVNIKVVPFSRILMMLKDGEALAGFNVVPTSETENDYIFGDEAIYITHQKFYYHKDCPIVIDNIKDIENKIVEKNIVVGEVLGYIYPPEYENLKKSGKLKIQDVKSDELVIRKLLFKRNRVALITCEVASYHFARMNIDKEIQSGDFMWEAPIYLAFSKVYPKSKDYAMKFDEGMRIIKKSGKYNELVKSYK